MSEEAGNTIWTPMYWGDYLRDTQDLDLQQHGAYFRLLAHYYTAGPPIPNTPKVWHRVCGAIEDSEKQAVEDVVNRFFTPDGEGGLIHKRADKEIQRRSIKAQSGQKGGRSRWGGDDGGSTTHKRSQRLAEARKKGRHTDDEWRAMLDHCGHACVRCGDTENIVKDHIKPIYAGGSDGLENLQPLCQSCNSSKGADSTDLRPSGWRNACRNA